MEVSIPVDDFNNIELEAENYNLLISNFILSQAHHFTYEEITQNLKNTYPVLDNNLVNLYTEKALLRMREDGFLSVLGPKYTVIECNI